MTSADRSNLERFVTAQAPVFETVVAELRAGRKRTHWMWFVFPQLSGLGRSLPYRTVSARGEPPTSAKNSALISAGHSSPSYSCSK
jgi:uncharacterized protein (DUF1810 family)